MLRRGRGAPEDGGRRSDMDMVDTRHETIGTEQARYPELTRTQYKYKHTVDRKTQTNGINYTVNKGSGAMPRERHIAERM